jgi:IS6 family transposase
MAKCVNAFKGRQFTAEVILRAVRWYLQFPVSFRDVERMLADRGVSVDHTTVSRSWRVEETHIRVKGRWTYRYRAVDSRGQTIDFLLSARTAHCEAKNDHGR